MSEEEKQSYEYQERVAICIENGVSQERAEELAAKQIQELRRAWLAGYAAAAKKRSPFGRTGV